MNLTGNINTILPRRIKVITDKEILLCQYIKHPEVDTNGVNPVRYITAKELKQKLKSKAELLMLMDIRGSELITSFLF
jgi:hypothetical protein